jgi:uncharacterized metal-binding protein YceD (DUF177 family)
MTETVEAPEFPRPVDLGRIGDGARHLVASDAERAALARRFGLVRIERLEADVVLAEDAGKLGVTGSLLADIVQTCAVSGDELPVHVEEAVNIRFVPAGEHSADEEIELSENECDEIEYSGNAVDLGEAVAQSLALAIDPFATGPNADRIRQEAGLLDEDSSGPFAALAALKKEK